MSHNGDVADKAVSTEDFAPGGGAGAGAGAELARLEAVLSALVRSKVVAIKAGGAARDQRLASSSTSSSDRRRRHGRHPQGHRHSHGHCGKRHSEATVGLLASGLFPRKRYRHHHHHHHHHHHEHSDDDDSCSLPPPPRKQHKYSQETAFCRQGYHNYSYSVNGTAACCGGSPTQSHSKMLPPDYVSLTMEEEEEGRRRGRRKKRRRRGQGGAGQAGGGKKQKLLEAEDLPARARWTIIATACLLLLMSILLVGVTLRMAPIIDEMVRKENEEYLSAIGRDDAGVSTSAHNSTPGPPAQILDTP